MEMVRATRKQFELIFAGREGLESSVQYYADASAFKKSLSAIELRVDSSVGKNKNAPEGASLLAVWRSNEDGPTNLLKSRSIAF